MIDEDTQREIQKVSFQLQALVDAVKGLVEVQEQRQIVEDDDGGPIYTMETSNKKEMERALKVTDVLVALHEIVNDSWQRGMIHHEGAASLKDNEGNPLGPDGAMNAYRDHIFDILNQNGIVLDDLL
jgi:hypothetical protein